MGDRDDLADAIKELGAVMKTVVFDRNDFIVREVRDDLREVWEHASSALNGVLTSLREGGRDLEERLATVGLLGASLRLKLRGFKAALDRFRARSSTATLLRALGWGDVFLGSLASVIPGGEILKEYKEALEQGVEDAHAEE